MKKWQCQVKCMLLTFGWSWKKRGLNKTGLKAELVKHLEKLLPEESMVADMVVEILLE